MRLDHLLSKETRIITTVDDSEVEIEKKEIREAGKDPGTESTKVRGCSSVGRAPALQAGGQGFESPHLHQEGA